MSSDRLSTSKKVLITGTAGFIGFHLAKLLLKQGFQVHGYDGFTDYYDVKIKRSRTKLLTHPNFSITEGALEDDQCLNNAAAQIAPDIIIHLAAQAGVRYSIENPRAYIDSNIIGTFNVMEVAKNFTVSHLLMASTSSVYGGNLNMPFKETDTTDTPMTLYAATKKANECMAHTYAHLWSIPTTMVRFFTVYGPWGRPDLALFKFVDAMLKGRPIDIYNHGKMHRDFTYVEDLAKSISLLITKAPNNQDYANKLPEDTLSRIAPYRVVNIGNSQKVQLLDFISQIEKELGVSAVRNYLDMQQGDVPATWADASLLKQLTGYQPSTRYEDGIREFVKWYRQYYGV